MPDESKSQEAPAPVQAEVAAGGNGKIREKLAQALQAEKELRVSTCAKELDALLKKHSCALRGYPWLDTQGRVKVTVRLEDDEGAE